MSRGMTPVRKGLLAGAVVVVVVLVALLSAATAGMLSRREVLDRLVVMVALPGEDDIVAPRLVVVLDAEYEPPVMRAVDPAVAVSIPGTDARELADAYAFRGPGGVVQAIAPAERDQVVPYLVVEQEALTELLGKKGVQVRLPQDIDVFTGEELLHFPKGKAQVKPDEVRWLLAGVARLQPHQSEAVYAQLSRVVAASLSDAGGRISGMISEGSVAAGPREVEADDLSQLLSGTKWGSVTVSTGR